jgi:ribulose-5-phosphate 4-epimerase/fuculose-1-phosphate aldolase
MFIGNESDEFAGSHSPVEVKLALPVPALVGKWVLVTATGVRFREVPENGNGFENMLVPVYYADMTTAITYPPDKGRVTGEFLMHSLILNSALEQGRNAVACLHLHSTVCSLLHTQVKAEELGQALMAAHTEMPMVMPRGAGSVPVLKPGGNELAEAVAVQVRQHDAVIMARHGALAVASDATCALDVLEVLEKAARLVWMERTAGGAALGQ